VGYLRLTDFGLSKMKVQNNDAMSICGTPEYLAPEIILKEGHGKAVDWWCLGSIIFEMISGLPPFYSKNRNELFDKIKHGKPLIPSYVSSKLRNLLEGLFSKNPEHRLGSKGAEEIKQHPWFEKINWEQLLHK
jgi:serine/threonine protein kinase